MVYGLLATSAEVMRLVLYYGICFGVILLALIVLALLKHKTKREMRAETIKKRCEKARAYAQRLLDDKKRAVLLGATKLMKLDSLVEEAAWLAFQSFDRKKDIRFEGIANGLDGLATAISEESGNGYISTAEYEATLRNAIAALDDAVEKLNALVEKR